MKIALRTLGLLLLVVGTSLATVHATTWDWINPNGGSFSDPTNWSEGIVPGQYGLPAMFNIDGVYQIDFTENITGIQLWIRDGDVTFDLNKKTYLLVKGTLLNPILTSDHSTIVGDLDGDAASLAVRNGMLRSQTAVIGNYSGSEGTVLVTGQGSSWFAIRLAVGFAGTGHLMVEDGGSITTIPLDIGREPASHGTVAVAGKDSQLIGNSTVGYSGIGEMTISNGGFVSGYGTLGKNPGSIGTVSVSGKDSRYLGQLTVGESGTGELTISNEGSVQGIGILGKNPGSQGTVTVTGIGSVWTSENLSVGQEGTGTLIVEDGGYVSADTLLASMDSLLGDGTIDVHGAILDGVDLVFDSTHGLQRTFSFGSGGQINLNVDGTGQIGAGFKGPGSLTIADGVTVTTAGGYIGKYRGSQGTATITGVETKWNSGYLIVGESGSGELTISNGANVNSGGVAIALNTGSNGTLSVIGPGSVLDSSGSIKVGPNGKLHVSNGGKVFTEDSASVSGMVRVSGPDTTWTGNGKLSVGFSATTEMLIENSAKLFSAASSIGTGSVKVMGANSEWNNSGIFSVSSSSSAELIIADGGSVTNTEIDTEVNIGENAGSKGLALVTGNGSRWNITSHFFYVGHSGTGEMRIENGGKVYNRYGYLGYDKNSSGTVIVQGEGSEWYNDGELRIGWVGSGSMSIDRGANVFGTQGIVGVSVGSQGVVVVKGQNSLWTNYGNLIIGNKGTGHLHIENGGHVSVSAILAMTDPSISTISFTLNDANATFFVDVYGFTRLNGNIDINLTEGFTPNPGDIFHLITAASYEGSPVFNFDDAPLPTGLFWDTSNFMTNGTISVGGAVPEPSSIMLMGMVAGFLAMRFRIANKCKAI